MAHRASRAPLNKTGAGENAAEGDGDGSIAGEATGDGDGCGSTITMVDAYTARSVCVEVVISYEPAAGLVPSASVKVINKEAPWATSQLPLSVLSVRTTSADDFVYETAWHACCSELV